ncbi:MAG: Gfo/Idh/MocA family protein [Planctomycetota bacterium]|jgi:predicted dehydrogenase
MDKIRTAVVGAGKMGSIHAKVYHQMPQTQLIAVVDTDAKKAEKLAKKYKSQAFEDCSELLGKVDAVTIAAPTTSHLELAAAFIEQRIPVLIEKPLATNVDECKKIVDLAQNNNTIVAVGHSERCNPVVQAMKRLNIEPKFIEAHRISPYPFRSTDISVVLDVMIHDIDIILSMARSEIKKIEAVGVAVIDDKEDICNARITFENGCIANITASRMALKTERKLRVFSKQAYISVDYLKQYGIVIQADPNLDVVNWIKEKRKLKTFDFLKFKWKDLLHVEELNIDDREPLRLEQEAFLAAVNDSSLRPEVSAEEGLAAMECAEKILDSARKHSWD